MFSIKTQSRIPIFEQLKKQILEYISAGVLHGDDQLPNVRMLASSLGINPNTVAKGLSGAGGKAHHLQSAGQRLFHLS